MGIWCLRCRQLLKGMILIKKILTIDIGYESLVKIFFCFIIYFANMIISAQDPASAPPESFRPDWR